MDNRRRSARYVVEGVHGRLTFASHVDILNMSVGGVALLVDRRLNIGREYTLKLQVHERTLAVHGVVVWSVLTEIRKSVSGEDIPIYSAGMKFTDVLTDRIHELIEFIDEHKIVEEQRLGGLRFHIDAPGKALLDYPQSYQVKVISLSGMLIETEQILEMEELYPMELSVGGETPIRFSGRVAYCKEKPHGSAMMYETGIEFLDLPEEDKDKLRSFIDALSRRS